MFRNNGNNKLNENDAHFEQEKANFKWREFAGSSPTIDHRRQGSTHSTTSSHANTAPSNNNNTNRRYYTPNQEQLELLLPVPIKCFCNQPAHKTYTAEYGPIFECASFGYDNQDSSKFQSKYICGFHVHERSWIKLVEDLKRGKDINLEFPELRTCPQYNFTFCSIFKVSNSYSLANPDRLPVCFCRRPVCMRISKQGFIQFACQNGLIEGAKKCSWVLPSSEVAFPKPKTRLHSLINEQQYLEQKERRREELSKKDDVSDHKTHLLATLVAYQPSSTTTAAAATVTEERPINSPPRIKEEKGFIVPTSVMIKKQQKAANSTRQQISPSTSSVSSTMSTPIMKPQEATTEDREYILQLQHIIEELKQTHMESMTHLREQLVESKEKMLNLQTDLYRMKNEKLEESIFTANCQERLSNIELDVVRLMNENQKLTDENMVMRNEIHELTSLKEDEPNKCIVCFTQSIDSCLKPCYHYAYCQACAVKLTSCAICRRAVKSVQRIYQS